jgi:hypothetical protein
LIKTGNSERIMQERMKVKELNRKEFFLVLYFGGNAKKLL